MVLGGGWSSMFIALSAVIQRDAPPASRGRVMSLMQATLGVSYGSGLLFIGIVWWTMFSGRKGGELPPPDDTEQSDRKP